jgi:hypothetical protein
MSKIIDCRHIIPFGKVLAYFKPVETTSSGEGVSNLNGTVLHKYKKKKAWTFPFISYIYEHKIKVIPTLKVPKH